MSEKPKPKSPERVSTFLRNVNALGAVAFAGAGVVLGSNVLIGLGAINAAQAGFFEGTRRLAKKRTGKKAAAPA